MRLSNLGSWQYRLRTLICVGSILLMVSSSLPAVFGGMVPLVLTAQATDGTPLAGVVITVYNSTGAVVEPWHDVQTGPDGRVILSLNYTDLSYNLTAAAPIGYTPTWRNLTFTLNATDNHLSLTFSPPQPQNAVLMLKVLDQDSNVLGDVSVTVTKAQVVVAEGKTASSGYFQAALTRGNYNLTAKKSLYQTVNVPVTLSSNGTLSAPTLSLVMAITQQPARGTYVVFTSQQLANIQVLGVGQINSFRWAPIQAPEIMQVYYTTYNVPQEILHFTTVFQGETYSDPSAKYFIRFTGRISISGQAQFDVWSSEGTVQAVIVDAPGLNLPYVGTPGKTWQIPVSTKSGDTIDVKLNGLWFASLSWAPVTIENQTLPQVVIFDTQGNKQGYTYMTRFNQTLIEYGGNQGFGLVLYKMLGTGTDSTAIWYIYSDLPITVTPNIGFGARAINLSSDPAIADAGQTVAISFVIPSGVTFAQQNDVSIIPKDYDTNFGLQVQQVDVNQGQWKVQFKPTNEEWNTAKDYTITISALGADGAKYFGKVTLSVSPQPSRTVWFWVSLIFIITIMVAVFVILRRRRNEPSVEKTVME